MTNRRLRLSSLLPFVLGLACITKEVPDDASGVDAGHVLEHLIGVDDVAGAIVSEDRRRPAFDDLEAGAAQFVDQDRAGFHRAVAPAGFDRGVGERALARADLQHVARRLRVLHQQSETRALRSIAPGAAEGGHGFLTVGEVSVEGV